MKKVILFLLTLLGLCTVTLGQKLALYEEYTGENCGPCASLNPALMTLLNDNPTKVLLIKYQTPIPSGGPINAQNVTEVQSRMSYYNVQAAPTGRINGVIVGTAGGSAPGSIAFTTQAIIDAAALETTPFELSIGTPTFTGNNFSVPVTITATSAASFYNAKLKFALVEDLEFATAPGQNGEKSFPSVMRKMYPNVYGTTIQAEFSTGQVQTITITGTIPTYAYSENSRIFVAWIQNDATKIVLQAAKSGNLPPIANALASNSITVSNQIQCGATATFTPIVTIRNTGTVPLTSAKIYIKSGFGPYGAAQNWIGNIPPGQSDTVSLTAITVSQYGEFPIYDSLAMPNGVIDDAFNNMSSSNVYLLNNTTEPLPQINDFENGYSMMWMSLPGIGGNRILNVDVIGFRPIPNSGSGIGYANSYRALVFPSYIIGAGGTGYYAIPKADMSPAQKVLEFYVAYVQSIAENDKLEVVYSLDCGDTWTSIWDREGASLSTEDPYPTFFKPSGYKYWRKESIDLSGVPEGARLAFRATSDHGNNIWIDNVSLRAITNGISHVISENSVKIYPNPIKTKLNMSFDLKKSTRVTINVMNTLGQVMPMFNSTLMSAGTQTITLNAVPLATGVYFVNIITDEGTIRKQFVKQ